MIGSYRLGVFLLLAVLVSALAVVYSSYTARQSFIEWQDILKQAQAYEVEWGQLLIEKSTLASYTRLEKEASSKLNMAAPSTQQIVVVQGEQP